ncbi:MAG: glycosyltransferase family 39 protein [Candidatus Sericytochromatia bacterium]|nr:glycosyltransferase family 39 protein [Candidatus Sericytochromatia bacterium]
MVPPCTAGGARLTREDVLWIGLYLLGLVGFFAATWARWPLLTADAARELYVPFQVLHGAAIYRDFYYLYGPTAPWGMAGLLAAFGERLEVLYVASGVQLAAIGSLLYAVARQLLSPRHAAAVLLLFTSHFALGRDLHGYVWPYSFAATIAVGLGLTVLLALLRHQASGRRRWLVLAGVAWGLSLVTKLEFGAAATGLVAWHLVLRGWPSRRWPSWPEVLALAAPAALAAGAVACGVLARAEPAAVLESIWPTRLMALWSSGDRWRGTPATWRANMAWLSMALVVLLAIARSTRGSLQQQGAWRLPALLWGLVALGAWLVTVSPARLEHVLAVGHRTWMSPSFLLAACVALVAWGELTRGRDAAGRHRAWALIAGYSLLVAARTLGHGLNDYTPYQAPVALILWVALATRWLPRLLSAEGPSRLRGALLGALLAGLVARHGLDVWRTYSGPHRWVEGPAGGVWNPVAIAEPFAATLAHLRRELRPGERVVAGPMEASFYLMLGQDNPVKEDQLFYGYLTTAAEERDFIARLGRAGVRFVVFSTYREGSHPFGVAYMPNLAAWLRRDCGLVATYGGPAYAIRIYETPFGRR